MRRWLCFTVLAFPALAACAGVRPAVTTDPPPGMVLIPAGPFWMGSDPTEGVLGIEIGVDESPRHLVDLPAFYIDKYEVTNAEYGQYAKAVGSAYQPAPWRERDALNKEPDHPVGDTDYYDADAYCRWAGKRLPTEAEWEKAARGPDGGAYPWGSTFAVENANTMESGLDWSRPVGSHPGGASVYGVEDLIGNVWEWTSSWYKPYPGSTLQRSSFGEKYRVLRGGSWGVPALPFARSTNRHAPELFAIDDRDTDWHTGYDVGFRCAKDAAR
jgi:formylglycine-generating enzyme required for sulfatase activity